MKEFEEKLEKLREWIKTRGYEGIILGKYHNFAWLTGGKTNFVPLNTEQGTGYFFITDREAVYFTTNIEAPRMKEEEFLEIPVEIEEVNWWEDINERIMKRAGNRRIAGDGVIPDLENLDSDLYTLRSALTPEEVERYYILGRECAESLEKVLRGVEEGISEREVAGRINEVFLSRGIYPIVNLVACDERIKKFRHPIPTDKKLKKYLMAVVCGRRGGLIVALTRLVSLGELDEEMKKKHSAVVYVDTVLIASTLPGEEMGKILDKGIKAYKEKGYGEEWRKHHQGGPIGYLTREFKVTPGETRKVNFRQPFAWNPSIEGTKSEDTIISYPESPLIITYTPSWPKIKVEYAGRVWERPDILCL